MICHWSGASAICLEWLACEFRNPLVSTFPELTLQVFAFKKQTNKKVVVVVGGRADYVAELYPSAFKIF